MLEHGLRKRYFVAAFVGAVLGWIAIIGSSAPFGSKQASERGPIRIGILHSLSGTMAVSERPVVDAALFAVDELNRQGGVLGVR